MPTITFLRLDASVEASAGTPLREVAAAAGIQMDLPCGGKGVCRRCMARVVSGVLDSGDAAIPDTLREQGFVLACRAKIADTDAQIALLGVMNPRDGQFSEFSEDLLAVDEALMPRGEITPIVTQKTVTVSPPRAGDGLSDYDRTKRALCKELEVADIRMPLEVLARLPDTLRAHEGNVSVRYWVSGGIANIVSVSEDERADYGLAVDIGTTTVAAFVVSMADGRILAAKTAYNAQIPCGLDIISRIHFARDGERIRELRDKVVSTINELTREAAASAQIETRDIVNAAISGNTTMIHMLMGVEPEYIRLDPYVPAIYRPPVLDARELGLDVNGRAAVYIAPSVGSYVGGDITSGLLCTRMSHVRRNAPQNAGEGMSLFIDIGTNGELVLGNQDFLMGCACSAGPAFEGGGIRNGCRAGAGAIERVEIDADTGEVKYWTIARRPPIGLCGSGVIRLCAELFNKGYIDAAGKFSEKAPLQDMQGRPSFIIAPESADNPVISISEADLDNLIRAKAAVFSACQTLLKSAGMTFDDLEHVYVAGGFGRYLDMEAARDIGLLPRLDGKVTFLGNASLTGSYMALISKPHRDGLADLADKLTYIDLSTEPGYMDEYMAALFLPHTTMAF